MFQFAPHRQAARNSAHLDALHLQDLTRDADAILIPVLPSDIDIHAASRCIADLLLAGRIKRRLQAEQRGEEPEGEFEEELRRYQMLRFSSRIGFKPPYFYNRALTNRLHRISAPTLVIWGENDHMVPRAHGETYARLIPGAGELKLVPEAGHSVHVEAADATARLVMDFLAP